MPPTSYGVIIKVYITEEDIVVVRYSNVRWPRNSQVFVRYEKPNATTFIGPVIGSGEQRIHVAEPPGEWTISLTYGSNAKVIDSVKVVVD